MNFQCPKCALSGSVDDSKISIDGTFTTCPKCKTRFLIKKDMIPQDEVPVTWGNDQKPVENINKPKTKKMGLYTKTFLITSSIFIGLGLMAKFTPNPNPPPPSSTTQPKPAPTDVNLGPMARDVKQKHPDWSNEICTAIGKGELTKGMNPEQASAAIESKKLIESTKPASARLTADEFAAECKSACSQISGFPVGSVEYNNCVSACTR